MKLSLSIKRLAIGIVTGAALLVGAAAPAFAQHHGRHNRNSGYNRRGNILGSIFGGNNQRHRDSGSYRRRSDRYYGWDGYLGADRHNRGRGRGHDRHRGRGHHNRW